MRDSLCFPYSINDGKDSPLAAFDKMAAFDNMETTNKPATSARNPFVATMPAVPLGIIKQNSFNYGRSKRSMEQQIDLQPKLIEKDRETTELKQRIEDLMKNQRQLEKALSVRDAKIGNLEKSVNAAKTRNSEMAMQLKMMRAELDRTKHRALSDHRQQEQRVATLEQTISRKMGLNRPGAYVQQELFINPLTGEPASNANCNLLCSTVLKASSNAKHNVETKIGESIRLEALCEMLERTFELNDSALIPQNIIQRLEVAVESTVELLDVLIQSYEDLSQYRAQDQANEAAQKDHQSDHRNDQYCEDLQNDSYGSVGRSGGLHEPITGSIFN